MDRLLDMPPARLYLALVAAGTALGAATAAVSCLADWARGRST